MRGTGEEKVKSKTHPFNNTLGTSVERPDFRESTPRLPHALAHVLKHLLDLHLRREICILRRS